MRSFFCFISFLAFFSPFAWVTFADANEAGRAPPSVARGVASPPLQKQGRSRLPLYKRKKCHLLKLK